MAGTPDTAEAQAKWWLAKLALKLATEKVRVAKLKAYLDGDAPLPEGAEGMREAYRAFQRKARTNFAELIVEAVQERMTPAGFLIGDSKDMDKLANQIWAANQLDVFSGDVHRDMLGLAHGYVLVNGPDPKRASFWDLFRLTSKGMPVITREDPALMVTAHDPLQPSRVVAALKMFRDEFDKTDYAYLYLPGVCYVATKTNDGTTGEPSTDASGYTIVETRRLPAGFEDVVPVVCFPNRGEKGEFENHLDTLARIDYMVLQRLVIVAMQAFRQKAIEGGSMPEVEVDATGAPVLDTVTGEPIPIDYADMFRPSPGALWMLPEGAKLWESQVTDTTPLLVGARDDLKILAAVTRTPVAMFLPEGANQSAEGATSAKEGLIFKTKDRADRARYGWNAVMTLSLRLAGKPADSVEVQWEEFERRSLGERADAASKAAPTGMPWRTMMTRIWGFSPSEVERMELERTDDALNASLGPDV